MEPIFSPTVRKATRKQPAVTRNRRSARRRTASAASRGRAGAEGGLKGAAEPCDGTGRNGIERGGKHRSRDDVGRSRKLLSVIREFGHGGSRGELSDRA